MRLRLDQGFETINFLTVTMKNLSRDPCWLLQDRPMAGRRQANVIDSTGFLELVAFPEERLGIEIDFLEARRFQQHHSAGA